MKFKMLSIALLLLMSASLLNGCAQSAPLTTEPSPNPAPIVLTDGLGEPVSLPGTAQRVISLAPSNTEILYAIGAGGQVVGRDDYSDYPEAAKSVTDIGGGFGELNTELILSQKPDLVLAAALTPPEQIKALRDLGLTVFAVANPSNFTGMFENIRAVSRLTGHEAQANVLIGKLQARLQAVKDKISAVTQRPLVFYELDGTDPNAPWTPGPGSFVGNLIDMAGGKNLGDELNNEWAQISVEELIAKNPDMILIGDATWGGVTLDDVRRRSGWNALKAIQDGHMYIFDDNLVSRPGPRMVDGVEQMAKLFHPELFK